ncbi:MAG: amidase [Hyphomicrobiales bacterium]|nr:MAG: amidase [Hyphomicrobiales bacterium]
MTDSQLLDLSMIDAARRIAAGEVSSVDLVTACLGRIAEKDGEIQAFQYLDPAHALAQARAADARQRSGRAAGRLNGVPIAVKDIFDTQDMPTEHGCRAFAGRQPEHDAACVAALRAEGAVIIGKTVTTELATLEPPRTKNPHNLGHTPGGSSSGSAAAVAAGMAPLALGSQTIGSVIRPAAFCGGVGYKPSFGLIPRVGVLEQAASLDTVGVLARSVDDAAFAVEIMQGRDSRDAATAGVVHSPLLSIAQQEWPLPPTFAFVKTHAWSAADAATHEAFGELVEELGPGQVQEISVDHTTEAGVEAARIVNRVELAAIYGPILDKTPELLSKTVTGMIEDGRRISGAQYIDALNARARFQSAIDEILVGHGAILTPAALGVAPKGHGSTGNPVFCAFWTYLGLPAVTLPLLEVDGMPMGVQIVGALHDDGRLLRTANALVRQMSAGAA